MQVYLTLIQRKQDKNVRTERAKPLLEGSGMPSRKCWIFTLILLHSRRVLWVLTLHFYTTGLPGERGVTCHPDNPPSDAYDLG